MTTAKFKVFSGGKHFDGEAEASVVINRDSNLISVRPKGRHRTYELRLEDIAQIIIERIIKAEVREKKMAKRKKF